MDFNSKDFEKLLITGDESEDKKPDDSNPDSKEAMQVRLSSIQERLEKLKPEKKTNDAQRSALNRAVKDFAATRDFHERIRAEIVQRDRVQEELLVEAKRKNKLQEDQRREEDRELNRQILHELKTMNQGLPKVEDDGSNLQESGRPEPIPYKSVKGSLKAWVVWKVENQGRDGSGGIKRGCLADLIDQASKIHDDPKQNYGANSVNNAWKAAGFSKKIN